MVAEQDPNSRELLSKQDGYEKTSSGTRPQSVVSGHVHSAIRRQLAVGTTGRCVIIPSLKRLGSSPGLFVVNQTRWPKLCGDFVGEIDSDRLWAIFTPFGGALRASKTLARFVELGPDLCQGGPAK